MGAFLGILLSIFLNQAEAKPLTKQEYKIVLNKAIESLPEPAQEYAKNISKNLKVRIAEMSIYPTALSVGVLARCQKGVGVCGGMQTNIGIENNAIKYSVYDMYGITAGMAEQYKIEFFVAACFGDCLSYSASGAFASWETGASIGVGASTFVEVGTDLSDWFGLTQDPPSLKKLLEYGTVYLGFGYNIGVGVGTSGTLYYYRHLYDETIPLN